MIESKYKKALEEISRELLSTPIGEQMKTFIDLCDETNLARGTLQAAFKTIRDSGSIRVNPRGRLGTIIIEKNYPKLLELSNKSYLNGGISFTDNEAIVALDLGLRSVIQERIKVPTFFSHSRTSNQRLEAVVDESLDFIVISKYLALVAINNGAPIEIAKDLNHEDCLSAFYNEDILAEIDVIKYNYDNIPDYLDELDVHIPVIVVHKNNHYLKQILEEVVDVDVVYKNKDKVLRKNIRNYII